LYTGTGYDVELLDWLKKYTFPTEAKYSDRAFAAAAYAKAVRRHLMNGTTTACYFATIHREGTMALVDAVAACGQRAFVGKVCMDRNAPDFYIETTKDSIDDTTAFVDEVLVRACPC
jgi:guanine deaminase